MSTDELERLAKEVCAEEPIDPERPVAAARLEVSD